MPAKKGSAEDHQVDLVFTPIPLLVPGCQLRDQQQLLVLVLSLAVKQAPRGCAAVAAWLGSGGLEQGTTGRRCRCVR